MEGEEQEEVMLGEEEEEEVSSCSLCNVPALCHSPFQELFHQ